MTTILALDISNPFIEIPFQMIGWLGLVISIVVNAALLVRWVKYHPKWGNTTWRILVVLTLMIPFSSLMFGIKLPASGLLSPTRLPVETSPPILMLLSAIPWVFAAGFLGPGPAAGLAGISGFITSYYISHNPFLPLEYCLIAILLSAALQQRFRTPFYRSLHHPFFTALFLSPIYSLIYVLNTLFLAGGTLVTRLDYSFTRVTGATIAAMTPIVFASVVAEIFLIRRVKTWGSGKPLIPSPSETSLETRFLFSSSSLTILLVIVLMIGDWVIAGNAARKLIQERMSSTASLAAEGIPYFLEAGQNLILQLAKDPRLVQSDVEDLPGVLADNLRSVPFFKQLFLYDTDGQPLAGYPVPGYSGAFSIPEEQVGIELALSGVPIQYYSIPGLENEQDAQISYLTTIQDASKKITGVLVGHSDLLSNPFMQPALSSLMSLVGVDGEGVIINEEGTIIFHTIPSLVMSAYSGRIDSQPLFYDETARDGTRRLVYFQPVPGITWSVILAVPARRAQQLALNIAAPLLGLVLLVFGLGFGLIRIGLRVVTKSLQNLALEADRISSGDLEHPLKLEGADEVGQLGHTFEQMRLSLRARLQELKQLLLVSQGVASSLDMEKSFQQILEAASGLGASSARIVLDPDVFTEITEKPDIGFGFGNHTDQYSYLDDQILNLSKQRERLVLTNPARMRLLKFKEPGDCPEAIIALGLRHENLFYGTLWIAYSEPHIFPDDEIRFMETLSGQASLAAENAKLFLTAEIGRQRLAGIVASTPDPVIVTDHRNLLLLANPAALKVLDLDLDTSAGKSISKIITQPDLVALLSTEKREDQSAEIDFENKRVYFATVSSVLAEGIQAGRVCVLRDITHFKELDTLKTDFVATVSHDLRNPLNLIKAYLKMMDMVGDLNELQVDYRQKMLSGIDDMTHLVENLLDLGRIQAGIGLQIELVSMVNLVDDVLESLRMQALQKDIKLEKNIVSHHIPFIEADRALLRKALFNLVDNSVKYTPARGDVQIQVKASKKTITIEVKDSGIGIAPIDQARIFEKFSPGTIDQRPNQSGVGLGLPIVKSIIERHHGKVTMISELGKGSTFTIEIPTHQPSPSGVDEKKPAK